MRRNLFARIAVVQEGREPLPRCDLCGMHMPEGLILKHQQTKRSDRNTQMRWRSREVAIASLCAEVSFSLTGDDKEEIIESVGVFKYLGRPLDRSDND